jgi:NADH:ubiquinone oxidoreductase subunit E
MARVKKETQEKVSAIMDRASDLWQEVLPKLNQIQKEFSEIGEGATTRNKKLERVIKYFSSFIGDQASTAASSED